MNVFRMRERGEIIPEYDLHVREILYVLMSSLL